MRKTVTRLFAALFFAATAAQAADLYLDLNGTAPGFDVTTNNSPIEVNFTNLIWNTDSTGGAGGSITNVNDGDILHFGLEGDGGILFNWTYFTNATVGGIHTYQTAGSTANINRFQVPGNLGYPYTQLRWAPGAFFETEKDASLWWNLGTVGDFEKIGNKWLIFADGGVKVNGTLTISTNNVIVRNLGTVDSNSSFKLNGGQLRFKGGLSGSANVGTLSGNGQIIRDGSGDLSSLTVNAYRFDMANGITDEEIKFGWGASAAMGNGTTTLDIAKIGGTNYADSVIVDWPSKTLTMDGDLVVTNIGSEALVEGDSFGLFSDNLAGSFNSVTLPDLGDPGLIWSTANLTSSGVIEVVIADASAPSIPTGLGAVSNLYTVSLDWDDNPEPTVTGYKVYRSDSSGGPWTEIAAVSTSEYLDTTTVPNDNTYYYQVSAYNFADVEGDPTAEVSTTVLFNLRNGDFELPVLGVNSSTLIDSSGDWDQDGTKQKIHSHTWAPESGVQGVRLEAWNVNTTNSFWQDKEGSEGIEYTLDSGFRMASNFIPNGSELDFSMVWLDAGKSEISREIIHVNETIPGDDAWYHVALTNTAPAGTAFVRALVEWRTDASNEFSGSASAFVDNMSLTRDSAPNPYDVWAGSWGENIGAPNHDHEGDGMENLLEYALGGDPTVDDAASILPTFSVTEDGGSNWFYYVHNERTDDNSLTYTVKRKGMLNIGDWETDGIEFVGESGSSGNFKSVTNRTATIEAEFIRLEVEQN